MNKNYVAPNIPVEELPEEYHYLRDLMEKEVNDTGLAGCAIYVNPQDEDMSEIYLYQECGTPIDEHTTGDGYYESCIVAVEDNQIEITV